MVVNSSGKKIKYVSVFVCKYETNSVLSAVNILGRLGEGERPDFTGKKVIIVGGGNVAMDACRSSVRLGAEKVTVVYKGKTIAKKRLCRTIGNMHETLGRRNDRSFAFPAVMHVELRK